MKKIKMYCLVNVYTKRIIGFCFDKDFFEILLNESEESGINVCCYKIIDILFPEEFKDYEIL